MAVKFAPVGGLNPGKPILWFEDKRSWNSYEVAGDGRLVVAREADNN